MSQTCCRAFAQRGRLHFVRNVWPKVCRPFSPTLRQKYLSKSGLKVFLPTALQTQTGMSGKMAKLPPKMAKLRPTWPSWRPTRTSWHHKTPENVVPGLTWRVRVVEAFSTKLIQIFYHTSVSENAKSTKPIQNFCKCNQTAAPANAESTKTIQNFCKCNQTANATKRHRRWISTGAL